MSNRTILFADDSATMRKIVEKTFATLPWEVTAVPSGEAAIIKAREMNPNIVIADAGMAGVSGYDVCKVIREDQSLASTPFIMMAGVSNPYDETLGEEVGVSEYVKKPFDTTALINKVGELADQAAKHQDETVVAEPQVDPSAAPASPEPIAKPIPEKPITKETIKFGRPSEPPPQADVPKTAAKDPQEFEPAQRPQSDAPPAEPRMEPIELDEPTEAVPESFQVGTLAEMAQIDENGERISPDEPDEKVEMGGVPVPARIKEAVDARTHLASEEIEEKVGGLSADQVAAIAALTNEVVERVVWEVVPELAEAVIKEELARLLEE